MSMVRVSVTLRESVVAAAREAAERRGISLSAWMREAVRKGLEDETRMLDAAALAGEALA